MKTICVDIPEKLAEALEAAMRQGYFQTEEEAVRFALSQLLGGCKPALIERFQREDIEWALKQKKTD